MCVLGAAWSTLLALSGCDPARVAKLEEGVSTEVQVREQFGEPATLTVMPDGVRVLDYPRQPEGWTNYRITIGADGKMSALRQLLHADNFAKVQPGQRDAEVRDRLGLPARKQVWDLKDEIEWSWRFHPDPNRSQIFSVIFDRGGHVLRTSVADDPREQAQAGS
jgi:2-polyprenyl-6-methoxyphenol hydroxylase-like FAD-dependent oxidoreductase